MSIDLFVSFSRKMTVEVVEVAEMAEAVEVAEVMEGVETEEVHRHHIMTEEEEGLVVANVSTMVDQAVAGLGMDSKVTTNRDMVVGVGVATAMADGIRLIAMTNRNEATTEADNGLRRGTRIRLTMEIEL